MLNKFPDLICSKSRHNTLETTFKLSFHPHCSQTTVWQVTLEPSQVSYAWGQPPHSHFLSTVLKPTSVSAWEMYWVASCCHQLAQEQHNLTPSPALSLQTHGQWLLQHWEHRAPSQQMPKLQPNTLVEGKLPGIQKCWFLEVEPLKVDIYLHAIELMVTRKDSKLAGWKLMVISGHRSTVEEAG